MENDRYLTAGEFARISGTTKHTLFHYDEIGLFSPQKRGENGYRYYSVDQLEIFDVICTLRELDMPLAQIREYLEQRSPEAFVRMLCEEKELVDRQIERLMGTRKWLEEKSAQIERVMRINMDEPNTVFFPEQYLICAYSMFTGGVEVAQRILELYDYCEKNGCRSAYNVGYIQHRRYLKKGIYDNYHTMYMLFDHAPAGVSYVVKPAGNYACVYHKGHWSTIGESYERLFAYLRERELSPGEEFYEDYMLDELTVQGQEHFVTRISVLTNK